MSRYTYDFHIHSCLSPCADNDMTPSNIAGMATLAGLNIVALTDHNTAKNCPAFFEAAKRHNILAVAGMELTGTVRNVIDFGAFVDIGVHQDGLVHISQISDKFIKHPTDVLSVGYIVKVKILDVDKEKKRISLTTKL